MASPLICFDNGDYYYVQNPVPWVRTSTGNRFPLKSYFNGAVVPSGAPPSTLPTIDSIAHLADSTGARIVQLSVADGHVYVGWHVKRMGFAYREDHFVVAQAYASATGALLGEWRIPRTTSHGTLSDWNIDAARHEAVVVYQTSSRTSVVGYRLE